MEINLTQKEAVQILEFCIKHNCPHSCQAFVQSGLNGKIPKWGGGVRKMDCDSCKVEARWKSIGDKILTASGSDKELVREFHNEEYVSHWYSEYHFKEKQINVILESNGECRLKMKDKIEVCCNDTLLEVLFKAGLHWIQLYGESMSNHKIQRMVNGAYLTVEDFGKKISEFNSGDDEVFILFYERD